MFKYLFTLTIVMLHSTLAMGGDIELQGRQDSGKSPYTVTPLFFSVLPDLFAHNKFEDVERLVQKHAETVEWNNYQNINRLPKYQ